MIAGEWGRAYALLPQFLSFLLAGAAMTVIVTIGGFVVAIILGILSAACRTGRTPALRFLAYAYVEVFRAVPVLTQLFIIYFGLAAIGIRLSPIPAAIAGFGLNGGAYLTEVFRGGIEAVGRGQLEAAHALGLGRLRTFALITLPQAFRIALPSLVNFAIGLLKDTSLASAVAAPELSFNGRILVDRTFLSTQVYLLVALFYLAMSLPLAAVGRTRAPHGCGAQPVISAALIASWLPDLAVGAAQTVEMAVLAYGLGAVLGLVITLAEGAGLRWLYRACRIYIEFIRGTPTLTQLFLIYFGLASLNIVIPGFQAAVIALGLHYAAYMAEVYRSGIAAIDRGQSEAAAALGLRRSRVMRLVVLPQAIRIILPPMTNFAISLLKDTAVASLIAAPELMMHATDITSEYYMPMPVYLLTGAFYFMLAYPLSLLVAYFERRSGQGRLRGDPA